MYAHLANEPANHFRRIRTAERWPWAPGRFGSRTDALCDVLNIDSGLPVPYLHGARTSMVSAWLSESDWNSNGHYPLPLLDQQATEILNAALADG